MERVGLTVATLGYVSELVSYFLAGQPATVYKLVARIMVKLSKSTKLQKYKSTTVYSYKKHRTAVKRGLKKRWSGLVWSGLVWSGLVWSGHENLIYTGSNAQNLYILA